MMNETTWHIQPLLTDWFLYAIVLLVVVAVVWIRRHPHLLRPWKQVFSRPQAMISAVLLAGFILLGLLDSVHIASQTLSAHGEQRHYVSVLDQLLSAQKNHVEKTYSAPFAHQELSKSFLPSVRGEVQRGYLPLRYVGQHAWAGSQSLDISLRLIAGLVAALLVTAGVVLAWGGWVARVQSLSLRQYCLSRWRGTSDLAWRSGVITAWLFLSVLLCLYWLSLNYHVFGTSKVGMDILYESVKSIRTGLLIGVLTTLFMLPFALLLGTCAGYFGGWIDDLIQYIYTTLSSVPGVLLISASVLVLQVYINHHATLFPTLVERADVRLLALCFILGVTGWSGLCRLLRGETLKCREQEFVLAARAQGVRSWSIIRRHIIPNVMHIVLISIVLDFSGLVLAEAVLSYVGVGVDPTTMSWGNMINSSRMELARAPMVWWPLASAMVWMFAFVLSANLFADCVRDAFDPRAN